MENKFEVLGEIYTQYSEPQDFRISPNVFGLNYPSDFLLAYNTFDFTSEYGRPVLVFNHLFFNEPQVVTFAEYKYIEKQFVERERYLDQVFYLDNELIYFTHDEQQVLGNVCIGLGEWNFGNVFSIFDGSLLKISNTFSDFVQQLQIKPN